MTGFDFRKEAEGLLDFIDKSPTVFHTVANAAAMLDAAGFCRLAESGHWELSAGKKYYVTRNGSSLIAFMIPGGEIGPFRLFCSHNDSPTFKVKVNAELEGGKAYTKLNVEQYGGALRAPWFDPPTLGCGMCTGTKWNCDRDKADLYRPGSAHDSECCNSYEPGCE